MSKASRLGLNRVAFSAHVPLVTLVCERSPGAAVGDAITLAVVNFDRCDCLGALALGNGRCQSVGRQGKKCGERSEHFGSVGR